MWNPLGMSNKRKPRRSGSSREELAHEEARREAHARLVAERAHDPRFVQKERIGDTVELSWSPEIPMAEELRRGFASQREAFVEKFGREPGPEDPVFFDPAADKPQPVGPEELDDLLSELQGKAAAGELDIDPALIGAWQELGYVVTTENEHLFSAHEIDEWERAVDRHRGADD